MLLKKFFINLKGTSPKLNLFNIGILITIIIKSNVFFGIGRHIKSKLGSWNAKVTLYKTLILPVLTYGSEAS